MNVCILYRRRSQLTGWDKRFFLSFSKKHLTDLYIKAWNTPFSQNTIGWFVRKTRHQKKERKNPNKHYSRIECWIINSLSILNSKSINCNHHLDPIIRNCFSDNRPTPDCFSSSLYFGVVFCCSTVEITRKGNCFKRAKRWSNVATIFPLLLPIITIIYLINEHGKKTVLGNGK